MQSGSVGKSGYLRLDFAKDKELGRTVLTDLDRRVPFLAQKALYWDESQPGLACVIIVETSGCVIQGDRFFLDVHVGSAAQALLTTQCATKIHCMEHNYAMQMQRFTLEEGSWLEFVPDSLILHRKARFCQHTKVVVPETSSFLYGEIMVPGRLWHHEEELFGFDLFSSSFSVSRREGAPPLMEENMVLEPEEDALCMPGVMGNYKVLGSLYAFVPQEGHKRLREDAGAEVLPALAWGSCLLPSSSGVLFRVLGQDAESVQKKMRELRSFVRETILGSPLPEDFLWR